MILTADNLQALNPVVSRALDERDPKPLQDIALRCERAGAKMLDINPGYLSRRHEDRMEFMVNAVQEVCSLPLVLDSPNPRLIARGLAACRETPILNAVSLEQRKLDEILPLAVEHRTGLVLLLMDERSMTPPHHDEKLALAYELREICLGAGVAPEKLTVDPVVPALSWPDAFTQAAEVVRTVRLLASGAVFGEEISTMAGLSNLRSGQRHIYPPDFDAVFLSMLAGAGLEYALVNLLQDGAVQASRIIRQFT